MSDLLRETLSLLGPVPGSSHLPCARGRNRAQTRTAPSLGIACSPRAEAKGSEWGEWPAELLPTDFFSFSPVGTLPSFPGLSTDCSSRWSLKFSAQATFLPFQTEMGRKSFLQRVEEVGRQQCRRPGAMWDTATRGTYSSPVTGDH